MAAATVMGGEAAAAKAVDVVKGSRAAVAAAVAGARGSRCAGTATSPSRRERPAG